MTIIGCKIGIIGEELTDLESAVGKPAWKDGPTIVDPRESKFFTKEVPTEGVPIFRIVEEARGRARSVETDFVMGTLDGIHLTVRKKVQKQSRACTRDL